MNKNDTTAPPSPAALLELAVGYQKSQTLFAFAELGVADLLAEAKMNAADVARRCKVHPLAMERFLNACAAIGLVRREDDGYVNSALSGAYLVKGDAGYLGGQMRRYQKRSYPQWRDLTAHLKNWKYGATADAAPETDDQGAEAMLEQHNLALLVGAALAESFDFGAYQNLLDLGGGTGAMSIALCERWPRLRALVFDLPENVEKAAEMVRQKGLKDRVATAAGDLTADELPGGFDVALLANLLAVFDAETNKRLFKKIYDRLPAGGACLVSGWILDEDRLGPDISVLFCLEDICWQSPDVERSYTVYRDWLAEAGFKRIEVGTYYAPTKLIAAYKE